MKHVALHEAKDQISALIDEVEAGEEIVITRHGKPAARLGRAIVAPKRTDEERRAAFAKIRENALRLAQRHPDADTPMTWEELKSDMEENR